MREKLKKMEEMFALQARLNDDTNGEAWREGFTKQGKRINWRRCIVMEAAELIDSLPWKHWKSIAGAIDLANIRIELVDIWHFVMSEALQTLSVEEAAHAAVACMARSETKLPARWSPEADRRLDALLAPYERLMALALDASSGAETLMRQFWIGLDAASMPFEDLYRLYIGKNALNQFRQKHGYKEGTYTKIWSGREDNAVLQEILANNPDIGYDALLEKLEVEYRKTRA